MVYAELAIVHIRVDNKCSLSVSIPVVMNVNIIGSLIIASNNLKRTLFMVQVDLPSWIQTGTVYICPLNMNKVLIPVTFMVGYPSAVSSVNREYV